MATVNIYLTFNGNCEEAFNFYKSVFGGEFFNFSRMGEVPPAEGYQMPDGEKNKIMHVALPISKETVIMGCDSSSYSGNAVFGNNFSISINTQDKEEAERFFTALSDGGKIVMPLEKTFWNAYFGMFTDKFGINWMVNCDL